MMRNLLPVLLCGSSISYNDIMAKDFDFCFKPRYFSKDLKYGNHFALVDERVWAVAHIYGSSFIDENFTMEATPLFISEQANHVLITGRSPDEKVPIAYSVVTRAPLRGVPVDLSLSVPSAAPKVDNQLGNNSADCLALLLPEYCERRQEILQVFASEEVGANNGGLSKEQSWQVQTMMEAAVEDNYG